jgi:site-specific DNA recombinase
MRAKTAAEAVLEKTEHEVEKYSSKRAIVGIPIGQTLREAWDQHASDLGWQRQIIGLVVDRIVVHPGGGKPRYKEKWRFDPNQIEIFWKA